MQLFDQLPEYRRDDFEYYSKLLKNKYTKQWNNPVHCYVLRWNSINISNCVKDENNFPIWPHKLLA